MTLLELLVKGLPKRGGWPDGVVAMAQDADGDVQNYKDTRNILICELFAGGESRIAGSYSIGGYEIPCASDRLTAIVTREQYEDALAASKTEWDGEGLPPVGCECEISRLTEWSKVRISYISSTNVVFSVLYIGGDEEELSWEVRECRFRPIRSEADKKRDEAVKAMVHHKNDPVDVTENGYHAIYDAIAAGKIPGIKLED